VRSPSQGSDPLVAEERKEIRGPLRDGLDGEALGVSFSGWRAAVRSFFLNSNILALTWEMGFLEEAC